MNPQVSNPKDLQVVSFHNSTDFGFTPEMGCMFDGRPINGISGNPGIAAGETVILPYHVGHRIAVNLAKRVLNTSPSTTVDQAGVPTGVPIWSETRLNDLASTFIKDLYTEAKPVAQSETDKLIAKVEEYKSMVDKLLGDKAPETKSETVEKTVDRKVYVDKMEVIAELEKRQIKFDRRQSKENLEKLL